MHKQRKVKLAALLLTLVIVVSGCGAASNTAGAGSAGGDAAAPQQTQSGGEKSLHVVVAKPTVVEDMNTNDASVWLEEKTGIHVTYDQLPLENINEKVALLLAGGDLPDIFLNCAINAAQINQYGIHDGVIIPLDDLIDQYGPNLKEAMSYFDNGFNLLKEADGKIYCLPTINPCFHCANSLKMWMNDEWLQTLNLSYPTTTDEFYNVLKAFKEQDPNGNGIADEIPITGATDGWQTQTADFVLPSFLPFDALQFGFGLDENGNVVNNVSDERFREALRYLNKLYSEGLLYEGTLTQKSDQLRKLVENPDAPLVGAVCGGFGGTFVTEIGGDRYRLYRPIAPLKGPEGVQHAATFLQTPTSGAFVITKDCADPALAMQWGDAFYTTEATATIFNGLKGVAWRDAEPGEIGFDGNQAIWASIISYGADVGKTRNDCWTQMGIFNFSAAWRAGQAVEPDLDPWSADGMEYMLHNTTQELYAPYSMDKFVLPKIVMTDEEYSKVAISRTEWENHYKEMFFNFVSGAWNLESDWDSFVQSLDGTYKMNVMLEVYQTAYNRSYK